jgi:uncharacterized repeat protein (TIGR01451 family)
MTTLISRRLRGVLSIALALAALAPATIVQAAAGLSLTTAYPSVVVSPGTTVSFDLKVSTDDPNRVDLALAGVPTGWKAELHGGGFVVGAVQTDGTDPTAVRLDVDVPNDATGTTKITLTATSTGTSVQLPLDIKVEENAGGAVTVEPDYEALRGSADQSFTFNLNVSNEKDEDLTYTSVAQGPVGWTVTVQLTGQSQAVSGTVKANGTSGATVAVQPADNAPAGTYPIQVVTTVGGEQYPIDLSVEVTGSYALTLSTPTTNLAAHGPAGGATEQQFTITNTGTAPITGVKLTGTLPSNWKVEFTPDTIDSIAPDGVETITAKITPTGDAIAGDYALTFHATATEAARDDAELRFTIETSILGAIIGAGLIAVAIGGLYWVFRRYGRR